MNNYMSISGTAAVVTIIILAVLVIGCCFLLLALQALSDKNKWLVKKNESLKERLSDKEFELYLTRNGLWRE